MDMFHLTLALSVIEILTRYIKLDVCFLLVFDLFDSIQLYLRNAI